VVGAVCVGCAVGVVCDVGVVVVGPHDAITRDSTMIQLTSSHIIFLDIPINLPCCRSTDAGTLSFTLATLLACYIFALSQNLTSLFLETEKRQQQPPNSSEKR
jgi:hypothetical protein